MSAARRQLRGLSPPMPRTRAQWPYEFIAEQTVMLVPRNLQIKLRDRRLGEQPLPVSPGWHPYFNTTKTGVRGDLDHAKLSARYSSSIWT